MTKFNNDPSTKTDDFAFLLSTAMPLLILLGGSGMALAFLTYGRYNEALILGSAALAGSSGAATRPQRRSDEGGSIGNNLTLVENCDKSDIDDRP